MPRRNLCVDGRTISKHAVKIGCEGTDWVEFARDKVQWQVLVNR